MNTCGRRPFPKCAQVPHVSIFLRAQICALSKRPWLPNLYISGLLKLPQSVLYAYRSVKVSVLWHAFELHVILFSLNVIFLFLKKMPNEEEPQPRPGETLFEFAERLRSMAKAIDRRARKRTIRSDYYFMKANIVES